MSIWDDISVDTGDYVSFVDVGDSVTGVITGLSTKTWDDGKTDPQLTIRTEDGEKTLTAGQVRLKAALAEHRPNVGDTIWIKLSQIEKRTGGKTLKHFEVAVQPKGGPKPAAPEAPADDAPPWAK
jgi:hypothetical protein